MRSSHERRISALEGRVQQNEQTCNETHYKLVRRCVSTDINVAKILVHLSIAPATDEEVDEALDAE